MTFEEAQKQGYQFFGIPSVKWYFELSPNGIREFLSSDYHDEVMKGEEKLVLAEKEYTVTYDTLVSDFSDFLRTWGQKSGFPVEGLKEIMLKGEEREFTSLCHLIMGNLQARFWTPTNIELDLNDIETHIQRLQGIP